MIQVTRLKKQFVTERGDVHALQGVTFEVPEGKLFTLLGPSGCGKTTTLRSIAGLERPDEGEIWIGGNTVFSASNRVNVPAEGRPIGMVFQSYAIWPHMTVFENVAYPLLARRLSSDDVRRRVRSALQLVGLEDLADRPAPRLSGGQQQRVALARALVAEPAVLLLDEPLSNLDAKLREQMRYEIRSLQRRVGITAVYVTHDQEEALVLSDQIAVMNAGRLLEVGEPRVIYQQPRHRFTADFLGLANFVEGDLMDHDDVAGIARVATEAGIFLCQADRKRQPGERVTLFFRPEDAVLHRSESGASGLPARVERVSFAGGRVDCWLRLGTVPVRVEVHPSLEPREGEEVLVEVAASRCRIVADDPDSAGTAEERESQAPGLEILVPTT